MSHPQSRIDAAPVSFAGRVLDLAMRVVPITALVAVGAFFAAQQAVSPHHRAIKGLVILGLTALMFRFDMVYSVYLFALLFAFPSGISIGSSNSVLMTLIPMIWAVRATSSRSAVWVRTPLDFPIAAFLMAHAVALYSVSDSAMLSHNITVVWRQFAACACFYCVYMFVNDEARLFRFTKILAVTCALVMLTAVLELFFPGRQLIPGWIGLANQLGKGALGYRIAGLRVGGAVESHDLLSDFGTQMLLFMVFFASLAKNPLEKVWWILCGGTTFIAVLATANRGGTSGMIIGVLLALYYFRRRLGTTRVIGLLVGAAITLVVVDAYLAKHTIAVSVIDRFINTKFEGMVPENRTMTWGPTLKEALQKPFFGHGPYFDTGVGLTKVYWPHNGFLFFFYTLGLFGLLAFFWVIARVIRESRIWRRPGIRDTRLGDLLCLAQVWLVILLWEQQRTDHQRDDIYPYLVWMCFGVIVTGAAIARRKLAAAKAAPGAATATSRGRQKP